ncbi:hypothetical protein EVAR_92592_1 [Eumeta japonica]|uniref:Uncharacterized protein n=1 Tax=Eumeta variegata TaxID=151549 RepID=A0A4C1SWQ0_EUMVA|nr:hypothetical protein EVAR_92592_1 [Eumeta japonica]
MHIVPLEDVVSPPYRCKCPRPRPGRGPPRPIGIRGGPAIVVAKFVLPFPIAPPDYFPSLKRYNKIWLHNGPIMSALIVRARPCASSPSAVAAPAHPRPDVFFNNLATEVTSVRIHVVSFL